MNTLKPEQNGALPPIAIWGCAALQGRFWKAISLKQGAQDYEIFLK